MNGKDLLARGIKAGPIIGQLLEQFKTLSPNEIEALIVQTLEAQNVSKQSKGPFIKPNSWLHWFLHDGRMFVPSFLEGTKNVPSTSEIVRLFENKAIVINGKTVDKDEEKDSDLTSLVFFPNSKKKTTVI